MIDTHNYFQSYKDYFWQWEDDGEVIAIPQDATIAYRALIEDIVDKLAPQGLPPFGSLLLVIVATNPNGSEALDVVYSIVTKAIKTTDDVMLSRAVSFLKMLAELPSPYKQGKKRIQLLQVLFERCHNSLSAKRSIAYAESYKRKSNDDPEVSQKKTFDRSLLEKDFRTVGILNNRFDSIDTIIKAIAALPDLTQIPFELEQVPGPASPEPKEIDFIDQLIENDRTYPVGSLIRWLWGGLNIPIHSVLPSQQPLGGISDLTNKGDFDKLLISEFANDDLFFLSRLANHEALYIHREIPPTNNNLERLILIDATLKNWGTPKTIAFGILLALARHPKTDIKCSAFVLGESDYYPVSIETIDSIIEALQIVEGGLHPALSLEKFIKDHRGDLNKEIFFITEASTVASQGLSRTLTEHKAKIQYQMFTDSSGSIDVYKRYGNSKKQIQHIQVPLPSLWKKHTGKPFGVKISQGSFQVNYPILVSGSGNAAKILPAPDGEIFQVNREKSVLRLFDKTEKWMYRGWDVVVNELPFKSEFCEIGMNQKGHYILLLLNSTNRDLVLLNLHTAEQIVSNFSEWLCPRWPSFIFEDGEFIHHNYTGSWSISLEGKIQRIDGITSEKFLRREKELKLASDQFPNDNRLFKNLNKVFINSKGELVFNKHTLQLATGHLHVSIVVTKDVVPALSSEWDGKNMFTFEDGSSVEMNRTGIIILRSSDRLIPDIYIPSTLTSTIGIATSTQFAGNPFYFKEPTYQIIVKKIGGAHTEAINILTNYLKFSQPEATRILNEELPVHVQTYCPKSKAIQLQEAMIKNGSEVDIIQTGRPEASEFEKVSVEAFYQKHITRFINTITNYANKSRTSR